MCAEQTTQKNAFRKSSNQNSSHHSHGDNDLRHKHERMNLRKTFDMTLQRFWIHPPPTLLLQSRDTAGEFHILVEELKLHHGQFRTHFRMSARAVWSILTDASTSSEKTREQLANYPNWAAILCRMLPLRSFDLVGHCCWCWRRTWRLFRTTIVKKCSQCVKVCRSKWTNDILCWQCKTEMRPVTLLVYLYLLSVC